MTGRLILPPPVIEPAVKRIICGVTLVAHRALLRGSLYQGGDTYNRWKRMTTPQPGDLVVESSTIYRRLRSDDDSYTAWAGHCLTYVEDRTVLVQPDPDDGPDEPPWTNVLGVCLNPDGTEYAWENHEFWVVPTGTLVLDRMI